MTRSWTGTGVESISAARICDRFLPTGIGMTGEAALSITDYTAFVFVQSALSQDHVLRVDSCASKDMQSPFIPASRLASGIPCIGIGNQRANNNATWCPCTCIRFVESQGIVLSESTKSPDNSANACRTDGHNVGSEEGRGEEEEEGEEESIDLKHRRTGIFGDIPFVEKA